MLLAIAVWGMVAVGCGSKSRPDHGRADESADEASEPAPAETRYGVEIRSSRNLGRLDVETAAPAPYETGGITCGTCHDSWVHGPPAERPGELQQFHRHMRLEHGELTCSSCHDPDDRDFLRLANGEQVAFADTIELCGQCHGPQYRDYRHGSHGGMTGYWDLNRGPQVRNHCVNCHDPHAPAYPTVEPAPGPRDRHPVQSSNH